MAINILSKEDLEQFKLELFEELRALLPATATAPKRWLRSYEVRKVLNISYGTLQTLRTKNALHPKKIGGLLFYDYEELTRLLQADPNKSFMTTSMRRGSQ